MKRRDFLKASGAVAGVSTLPFNISIADAADTTGYKALVCVFLFGGNDSHNTIVPNGLSEYNTYSAARGGPAEQNGLALPRSSLLPILSGAWGLHPAMSQSQALFNSGKLAFIANVGPLLAETTLQQYQSSTVPLPPQLFSHLDMQVHWQTMRPDTPANTGWGGRLADVFKSAASGMLPVSVSVGGGGFFMKGNDVSVYQVRPTTYVGGSVSTAERIARTIVAPRPGDSITNTQGVFLGNASAPRGSLLEQQYSKLVRDSVDVGRFVTDTVYTESPPGTYTLRYPVPGAWPTSNRLSAQLHSVASMIAARQQLGVTRQIFFVSLPDFDTHGDQFGGNGAAKSLLSGMHYNLLRTVDEALSTFQNAMTLMGLDRNVTVMTMSDFGRTLKSNGQGSDHGWGGHMMVLGGSVNGGQIYGTMPPVALNTSVDVGDGRLLPTLSSDAYAATLATWLGATPTEINSIFPNLTRFNTRSVTNLMS
jgi:uncharacterized protein (DUF1501 family)